MSNTLKDIKEQFSKPAEETGLLDPDKSVQEAVNAATAEDIKAAVNIFNQFMTAALQRGFDPRHTGIAALAVVYRAGKIQGE